MQGQGPPSLWKRKLVSGSPRVGPTTVTRRQPAAAAAALVGVVDQVGVRGAGLEQKPPGAALGVVAAAERAALVEDLALDAIERAVEERARVAPVGAGSHVNRMRSMSL